MEAETRTEVKYVLVCTLEELDLIDEGLRGVLASPGLDRNTHVNIQKMRTDIAEICGRN